MKLYDDRQTTSGQLHKKPQTNSTSAVELIYIIYNLMNKIRIRFSYTCACLNICVFDQQSYVMCNNTLKEIRNENKQI